MSEHPILFSSAMVKAILEGRKTQTRRLVNPPAWTLPNPHRDQWGNWFWLHDDTRQNEEHLYAKTWPRSKVPIGSNPGPCCPYGQPGDELVFLTTWAAAKELDSKKPSQLPATEPLWSLFDGEDKPEWCGKSRPGRFMPVFLRGRMPRGIIRDVRVQRLWEITAEDAKAEGITGSYPDQRPHDDEPERYEFEYLWNSINYKRAPWHSNPWVWAITFERKA